MFSRVLRTRQPESFEYPQEVLGGKHWFLARVAPIPGPDEGLRTLIFLARDITERKRMEEELRASERRFHQILEQIQMAALVFDRQGRIVFCNDFLLRLLGRTREEIVGADWFELCVPSEDRERVRHFWRETIESSRTAHHISSRPFTGPTPRIPPGRDSASA